MSTTTVQLTLMLVRRTSGCNSLLLQVKVLSQEVCHAAERALENMNYQPLNGRPMRIMWSHRQVAHTQALISIHLSALARLLIAEFLGPFKAAALNVARTLLLSLLSSKMQYLYCSMYMDAEPSEPHMLVK